MSPEAEAKFKERAAELGKDAGAYASEILENAVTLEVPSTSVESFEEILDSLIEEARHLPRDPGPPLEGLSAEFAEGVVEDLRRQGLKL
jgi:hypothetical protein